jgi:uncharacterized membrane protein YfcA
VDWQNAIAGFGVGAMVGMTGVGGGSLMTPILVLLFGVAPAAAVGTDLWFAALTKMVGGVVHHRRGSVDWQVFRRLSLGSLPASVATLVWLHQSNIATLKHGLIVNSLGVVLMLTALAMLLRKKLLAIGTTLRVDKPDRFKGLQPVLTVVAGAILGFLVTLTSVGGGALGTVMLLFLYPFRMKPTTLVGTDIVHAIPLTIVAGLGHLMMGNVNFMLLGNLLLGSVPGILLGSLVATRAPEKLLRGAIATVLVLVASKLLLA